jgi:hypothetical protein
MMNQQDPGRTLHSSSHYLGSGLRAASPGSRLLLSLCLGIRGQEGWNGAHATALAVYLFISITQLPGHVFGYTQQGRKEGGARCIGMEMLWRQKSPEVLSTSDLCMWSRATLGENLLEAGLGVVQIHPSSRHRSEGNLCQAAGHNLMA